MRLALLHLWPVVLHALVDAWSPSGPAQRPLQSAVKSGFDTEFDRFVEETLDRWHVPGLSIAIVENGKITSKGYGYATLPDHKATADTRYFTASTTKAFTAAAVGMLIHDNDNYSSIQWTSPINHFLRSDFVLESDHATNHITIEDALSHRSGLPGHDTFYGQDGDTPSKVVQRLRWLPMNVQPRTEWQYCNVMYAVITDLLQTLTGKALEVLLRESIWDALGMRSTSFTIPSDETVKSRVATGYYWVSGRQDEKSRIPNDGHYIPERLMDLACTSGDGATLSTVNDYALWIRALLNAAGNGTQWNRTSPISRGLYRDLVSPRAIIPVEFEPDEPVDVPPVYALGWITAKVADQQVITHSGGIDGFGTEVWMLPGMQYGVITMANANGADSWAEEEIVSSLLVKKLYPDSALNVDSSEARQGLFQLQHATALSRKRRKRRSSRKRPAFAQTSPVPLPLPLTDFAGMYSHPAYGNINFTITEGTGTSSQVLTGIFHPRANVEKQVLSHISGTLFKLQSLQPHGRGNVFTGEGVVWEDMDDEEFATYGVFELSADGMTVELLGLDLDPDMVRTARREGDSHWMEGMIWFKKV